MTFVPRYNFLPGTEITLLSRPMVVNGIVEGGYSMVGREDGVATVVSFNRMVEHLSLPGAQINAAQAANGDRHRKRLGGYLSVKSLKNKEQLALGQFHFAMCQAVDIYAALRQQEDPKFEPTVRKTAFPRPCATVHACSSCHSFLRSTQWRILIGCHHRRKQRMKRSWIGAVASSSRCRIAQEGLASGRSDGWPKR